MKRFADLFRQLDETTRSSLKIAALAAYLRDAPATDRVWTIALLSHRRPRRVVTATELRLWAAEAAGIPDWLFAECYAVAGDLAETIAHLLAQPSQTSDQSLTDWITWLEGLRGLPVEARREAIVGAWDRLEPAQRLVFNKLITGGFRMGVSQGLMTRALAQATGVEAATLAHRLMGNWNPGSMGFDDLIAGNGDDTRPYPFALAHQLDLDCADLGLPADWCAEWKWDGIRAQIIRRHGELHVWSRGEELMTDRFCDLAPLLEHLPDGTVIDGELLVWDATTNGPRPFAALQARIGRKTVPKRLLAEAPVRLIAYDLLEHDGADLRRADLQTRRDLLAQLILPLAAALPIKMSPDIDFPDWPALAGIRHKARAIGAEGMMLKRRAAPYFSGRKRGDWWKWKLDPFTVDAVMIYAQAGHGRRATLFTDFTFAVLAGNDLVPVAKAYSGLTDMEFAEISAWVRKNTLERFGPVRRVKPELVFEIAFEAAQSSTRHKSGIALRFPRMLRWRRDVDAESVDRIETLQALVQTT